MILFNFNEPRAPHNSLWIRVAEHSSRFGRHFATAIRHFVMIGLIYATAAMHFTPFIRCEKLLPDLIGFSLGTVISSFMLCSDN